MSLDVRANRSVKYIIGLYVVAPGLLLIGLVVFLLTGGSDVLVETGPTKTEHQENHLATVRATLAKQTDQAACVAVVPQLNAALQNSKEAPVALSSDVRHLLRTQLSLTSDDLAEVESPTFTALDASHLECCLWLRDAVRGLELATPGGRGSTEKQTSLDRARAAFAWVMRQVSLPQRSADGRPSQESEPAPPQFVLRRGWGTPLERAGVPVAAGAV